MNKARAAALGWLEDPAGVGVAAGGTGGRARDGVPFFALRGGIVLGASDV